MPVELRPAAAADVEDAATWYESRESGLGSEYLEEVRTTLTAISDNPERFPTVYRETRRALVHRFPYAVFYRVLAAKVLVIACMHSRRQPTRWKLRR